MVNTAEAIIVKEGKNVDKTFDLTRHTAMQERKIAVIYRTVKRGKDSIDIPVGHFTPQGDWCQADAHSMRSYVEEYMGDKYGDLYHTINVARTDGRLHNRRLWVHTPKMQDIRRWHSYQIMAAMVSASRSILSTKHTKES